MKFQWKKQFICYLFIAILLTSGMCVQLYDPHSYFSYELNSTARLPKYETSISIITSDCCTNELLQQSNPHYIRNNPSQRTVLRRAQHLIIANLNTISRLNLHYFEGHYLTCTLPSTFNKAIIMDYIHRQDGAK